MFPNSIENNYLVKWVDKYEKHNDAMPTWHQSVHNIKISELFLRSMECLSSKNQEKSILVRGGITHCDVFDLEKVNLERTNHRH